MELPNVKVGLLFSLSGPYSSVSRAMAAGAGLAADEINSSGAYGFTIEMEHIDPKGELPQYMAATRHFLGEAGLKHVVGCYTSSSRKEIIPLFEKHDALLWYPSHYEGFETSENVVYSGAAPNQHIIPLAKYLLGQSRKRGWFIGSNYIWAWENNRIMREALSSSTGGEVVGERYFPVGDTDVDDVVRQIIADRPDFIFATLIGDSLYAFLEKLRLEAAGAGVDQPAEMPVVSCSLSEAELPFIPEANDGHIVSSVYFSTIETAENNSFTRAWSGRFAEMGEASCDTEATYFTIYLLAEAIRKAGTDAFEAVREAVRGLEFAAPQGRIRIDPDNLHCRMRPRIGRSRRDGTFEIVYASPVPVNPDPYLTWTSEEEFSAHITAGLKVIK